MTYPFRWLAGLAVGAAAAVACSSSSGPPGSSDSGMALQDSSTGQMEAGLGEDSGSVMDGPAAPVCDAISTALMPDAALSGCFQCEAMMCATDVAACAIDCTCAPAYRCLEDMGNSNGLCPMVMAALANSNTALTNLEGCAAQKCNSPCYGGP
jgi:hypothetical protein